LIGLLVHAVRERRSRRLVDDTLHIETRNLTSDFRSLASGDETRR
jgi:hypothetical protein